MSIQLVFVSTSAQEQRRDLCRWVERLVEEGHRVFVLVGSTMSAEQLDGLLWSFSKTSFVPHRIVSNAQEAIKAPEPVLIGWDVSARGPANVLVCDDPPDLDRAASFEIVVHFVPMDDPEKRERSRSLWVEAKNRGYALRHVAKEAAASPENHRARSVSSP